MANPRPKSLDEESRCKTHEDKKKPLAEDGFSVNEHGTAILGVLWDKKDLTCMSDGRSTTEVEGHSYVKQDASSKLSALGNDYIVATSGSYHYGKVVIRNIDDQFPRPKKPNKEEMKDAIEKVKQAYVENWSKEVDDQNTYTIFPSVVCLYGLDDIHVIAKIPYPYTEKEMTVDNGTKVKIFFQGSGGILAYDHLVKIIGKATSQSEVLECMRESMAVACLQDEGCGGFIRYVCYSRGGEIRFSHEEGPRHQIPSHYHHVTKVVSDRYESVKEHTSQMLLVFRSGSYTDDPKNEVDFEKRLMKRFTGASVSVIGVQRTKKLTVRKLWCESTQKTNYREMLADAFKSINDGEFDMPEKAGDKFEMKRKVWCEYATKEVFQTVAEDFKFMTECL